MRVFFSDQSLRRRRGGRPPLGGGAAAGDIFFAPFSKFFYIFKYPFSSSF
jgi:hypothetical protein